MHRWISSCASCFLLLPVSLKGLGLFPVSWCANGHTQAHHPFLMPPSCPSPLLPCTWVNPELMNEETQEEKVEGGRDSELAHVLPSLGRACGLRKDWQEYLGWGIPGAVLSLTGNAKGFQQTIRWGKPLTHLRFRFWVYLSKEAANSLGSWVHELLERMTSTSRAGTGGIIGWDQSPSVKVLHSPWVSVLVCKTAWHLIIN